MDLSDLKVFHVEGENAERNWRSVELLWKQLQDTPIINGRHITGITVSGVVTNVEHKLGRNYKGFITTDVSASRNIYRDSTSTLPKDKFLPLLASAAATISIWVF